MLNNMPRKPSLMSVVSSLCLSPFLFKKILHLWVCVCASGCTNGRGAEERAGKQQHTGENKKEYGFHNKRCDVASPLLVICVSGD